MSAADRLGVRRIPLLNVGVGVDGGSVRLRGRLARPRLVFGNGEDTRTLTGIFGVPASTRADGAIGPGVLPYDIITIRLGPEPANARNVVFALENDDIWAGKSNVGGHELRLVFDLVHSASVFNRPASRLFDASGGIVSSGELVSGQVILGLTTLMQPVQTEFRVEGLALGTTLARTNAPLLGADDAETVVVQAEGEDQPPPGLTLGREALAQCGSITVDRRAKTMTLRCAG